MKPLRSLIGAAFFCIFRFSLFTFHYSLFRLWEIWLDVLYPYSKGLFLLGAGRGCEGKNHKEREVFAALRSPLSLRFSPSRSLFPYPLLSNGVSRLLDVIRLFKHKTFTR